MADEVLTPAEDEVMRMTFKSAMLRAADIIDHITADDVLKQQAELLRMGSPLTAVARLDRAMIAAAYLRLCAEGKANQ